MDRSTLPVIVIGAGPVGLAAAAHLVRRGETPLILEAGPAVGASVLKWGHVQLFTPWSYATDGVASRLLTAAGWKAPNPDRYPTGRELVEHYLLPLAELPQIRPHLRVHTRVRTITRQGFDKMKTVGREAAPFVVSVSTADGAEETILARAVIDASGSYQSPNPVGASGVPARGERAAADRIFYGIPDVLGAERDRYANQTVLVAGSGASAFNALLDLAALAERAPATRVIWVLRRGLTEQVYGGGDLDQLPARGALGQRVRHLVEQGTVQVATGFKITAIERVGERLRVVGEQDQLGPVDQIIVTTGFRPDLSILSELRLALDPAVESPVVLAPLIDPNVHSCGTVRPHGVDELSHPEPDFYIIGSKSYGRAPTFLLLTGYEQARSVVAAIAGDWEAARQVQLVLPETGVCSGDADSAGCAVTLGPPASEVPLLTLTASSARAESGGCCSSSVLATCCEANVKDTCCGATPAATCGCQ
ncbi:MAG TPA: NAD(P)-binding domain-containing protein [Herpetosiphonaceae bacterium]